MMTDNMGSKQATYQVHDDSHKIGKYTIRVIVIVRVVVMVRVRVRAHLPMEQPHELIIIIN